MLNVLGLQPWVIAKQLRHGDEGALVLKLYGHPSRSVAIDSTRRGFGVDALGRGTAPAPPPPARGTRGGVR
jgi:hypothetical protein